MTKVYNDDDKNFANPITKIMLKILNVEINLIESNQSNIINLLNKTYDIKEKS